MTKIDFLPLGTQNYSLLYCIIQFLKFLTPKNQKFCKSYSEIEQDHTQFLSVLKKVKPG